MIGKEHNIQITPWYYIIATEEMVTAFAFDME